jgi:hypothetical protein
LYTSRSAEYRAIEADREREVKRLADLLARTPPTSATYTFQISQVGANSHDCTGRKAYKLAAQGYNLEHPSLRTLPRRMRDPGPFNGARPETYHQANSRSDFIDLLERAEDEVLGDIDDLHHNRAATLKKPTVLDKYLPDKVHQRICSYPDILRGFNAISKLEAKAMPNRRGLLVMMANTDDTKKPDKGKGPMQPSQGAPSISGNSNGNGNVGNSSTPSDSATPPVRETQHPPTPVSGLGRQSSAPSPTAPRGYGSPSITLQVPVDRRLALDSPSAPRSSPALSNDAGEGLGNLTQLTQRLEVAAGRTGSAGIVAQSRFASPADWQGKRSYRP